MSAQVKSLFQGEPFGFTRLSTAGATASSRGCGCGWATGATLAAIEAERPTVPVLTDDSEGDGEVERILDQSAENEHRAGLTAAERIGWSSS